MGKSQLPALTGIRFVLAFWVVVYHQLPTIVLSQLPGAVPPLLHTGYAAVTAFFLLSGFVLAYNYSLETSMAPSERNRFFVARFSRIYPAYFFGLILLIPLGVYRLWAGLHDESPLQNWNYLLASFALIQAWIPDAALSWNYPGWSLSNEIFFYASFPLLGHWLWSRCRGNSLWVGLAILWLLSLAAPAAAIWTFDWAGLRASQSHLPAGLSPWMDVVRYNPLLRLPEFCSGVLLAKLFLQNPPSNGTVLTWLSAVLTVALLANADHIPYSLLHNGLALPLFGGLLLGLASGQGLLATWLSSPLMRLLGNASYSMYILHVPVYSYLGLFVRRVLGGSNAGWVWMSAYAISVVVFSCLFFKFVEEPLHRMLRSRLQSVVADSAS